MFNRPYDVDSKGLPIKNEKYFNYNRKFHEFENWLCSLPDKERDKFLSTKQFYSNNGQPVKFVRSLVEKLPKSSFLIVFVAFKNMKNETKIVDVNFNSFDIINENTFVARKPIGVLLKETKEEVSTSSYSKNPKKYSDFGLTESEYKAGVDFDL